MRSLAILTASLTTLSGASALSKLEPPNGKILFGVWFDGTGNTSSYSGGDTASAVNSRLGFNVGSFQVWQELPLKPPASGIAPLLLPSGEVNMDMFDEKTDASIFLTVYPDLSATITDDHIKALGTQCAAIIKGGRNVFIRLGPEMNGEWMQYGNKPTQFVALWKRVYTILNETAPQVAMVWSPNYNGVNGQNPFDPYWPGPEFVDWIGISLYWKGFAVDWPWGVNKLAPSSYTAGVLTGTGGESAAGVSIYDQFAVKYGKPLVISETGAGFVFGAFNPSTQVVAPVAPGPGRKDLQMSFWSGIFNEDFLKKFPMLKMVFSFECYKREDNFDRDFRVTVDPETSTDFAKNLELMETKGFMLWANNTAATTTTTTYVPASTSSIAVASTVGVASVAAASTPSKSSESIATGKFLLVLFVAIVV